MPKWGRTIAGGPTPTGIRHDTFVQPFPTIQLAWKPAEYTKSVFV